MGSPKLMCILCFPLACCGPRVPEDPETLNLVSTVVETVGRVFSPEDPVVVSLSVRGDIINDIMLLKLHEKEMMSIKVVHGKNIEINDDFVKTPPKPYNENQFIYLTQELEEFYFQFPNCTPENVDESFQLNPLSRFLILLLEKNLVHWNEFGRLLSNCKICNVVIIKPANVGTFELYTWYPYKHKHQCGSFMGMDKIGVFKFSEFKYGDVDFFPEKIPRSFNMCPISVFSERSLVGRTPNALVEALDGLLLEELVFKRLQLERVNAFPSYDIVSGGSFLQMPVVYKFIENTHPYITRYLKWFVPCGKPNLRQGHIFKVFKPTLWLLTVSVLLLAILVSYFLQNTETRLSRDSRRFSSHFLNFWAALLGMSTLWTPSNTIIRMYLFLWITFALGLGTVFQAYFTLFFVEPGHQKQISSLQEISESGIKYGISYSQVLCNDDDLESEICSNTSNKDCDTAFYCVYNALTLPEEFAFPSSSLEIEIVKSVLGFDRKFCYIDDNATQLYSMSNVMKNSYFWPSIRDTMNRLAQSGLFDVFKNEYLVAIKGFRSTKARILDEISENLSIYLDGLVFENETTGLEETEAQYFQLGLLHLTEPLTILLVGYILGFIAWVAEIFHHRYVQSSFFS